MPHETVRNLAEFYNVVSRLDASGHWIFRGQSDAAWGLIPSVFRGVERLVPPYDIDDAEWISKLERDTYRAFEQHARSYEATRTQWEALALAQHYGTPTRLLDWTRNASIGAYFAVATTKNTAAAVWCLNLKNYPFPDFLGRTTKTYAHRTAVVDSIAVKRRPSFFQDVSRPFTLGPNGASEQAPLADPILDRDSGFLLILDPPRFDARLKAQDGLFTLHYSFDDYDIVWDLTQHLEQVEAASGKDMLWKIEIPEDVRDEVRHNIEQNQNLNWHRLFPDLVGLGEWLNRTRNAEFITTASRRL